VCAWRFGQWPLFARVAGGVTALIVIATVLFVRVCADGGAMGAAYRTCRCEGIEWQLYDRQAADGPRRTVCLGWVAQRTCYRSRDGLEVPCPGTS